MIDARKCALIDWLPAEAFGEAREAALYRLIRDMHSKGDPVDVITVAERSPEGWQDHEVLQLAGDTPSASNVVAYAEILLQAWKRSSVARVASALASDCAEMPTWTPHRWRQCRKSTKSPPQRSDQGRCWQSLR